MGRKAKRKSTEGDLSLLLGGRGEWMWWEVDLEEMCGGLEGQWEVRE